MSDDARCGSCQFWSGRRGIGEESKARCRRHAPVYLKLTTTSEWAPDGQWPYTFAHDWCGDFELFTKEKQP